MDASAIPWPAIPVIFGLAVAGTVWGLQKLKLLAYSSKRWTKRIPKWIWLLLSVLLPFGLVIFLAQPWVFGWLNTLLPESMQVDLGAGDMLSVGVSAVFGSGGAYSLAKKGGLVGDYSDVAAGSAIARGQALPVPVVPEATVFPEPAPIPKEETAPETTITVTPGPETTIVMPPAKDGPVVISSPGVFAPPNLNQELPIAKVESEPLIADILEELQVQRGPFVMLVQGKLYGARDGEIVHLPLGWHS